MLGRWEMELLEKIIPANLSSIRSVIRRDNGSNSYDDKLWADISALKTKLAKDSDTEESVFTGIKKSIAAKNWEKTTEYQLEMKAIIRALHEKYKEYCDNQV